MTNSILVVDDDRSVQVQLLNLLGNEYKLILTASFQEALSIYRQLQPDLVLLAARMFLGMEELACLPDRPPIIAIADVCDQQSTEQALAAGAADIITKPIQAAVLRQRVHRIIQASQLSKTLRQQSEQVHRQKMQLNMVLAAARAGTWSWNTATQKLTCQENLSALFGCEEETTSDHSWEALKKRIHPEDRDRVYNSLQQAAETETEWEQEFRIVLADGSTRWLASKATVLRYNHNQAVQMLGISMDITKSKLAEENLRQSEERFHILARATKEAIRDWNLIDNQMWWNDNLYLVYGYSPEQVDSEPNWWYEHIHPEDRAKIISEIQTLIANQQQFWSKEYRFRRADGSYAYIFDRAYAVQDSSGKLVRMIGVMLDISDRKQAQEELLRQNMQLRLFADLTLKIRQSLQIDEILHTTVTEVQKLLQAERVVIFRIEADGSGTVVKEAVVPGVRPILGQNIVDPCFSEAYIEKYRQGRIGSITNVEDAGLEPCYVEFLQQIDVKANLVVPILQQSKLWGLLIVHQCTHPRNWNEWETELLLYLANQIGIALAQAKLLEQETRQRQELARSNDELQEFAFVASHDLQEPLRKIKTFGDRLKITCSDRLSAQERDYLERMQNAALRMQNLIEDLLTLSRVTTRAQPFEPVNLFQVAQEVLSDLEITIQQTQAKIQLEQLPVIKADPLQMRQLLQNLIANALKFHRPQQVPVVKIYSQILPVSLDSITTGTEKCQIIIEDNGIGFDEKYLDRIFNVFQRLHGRSEYEGTGIGLAICRKIVERHQGTISAQSKKGHGTKFIVTLPMNLPS